MCSYIQQEGREKEKEEMQVGNRKKRVVILAVDVMGLLSSKRRGH